MGKFYEQLSLENACTISRLAAKPENSPPNRGSYGSRAIDHSARA